MIEAPLLVDDVAEADARARVAQRPQRPTWKHDVVPAVHRLDPLGEPAQLLAGLATRGGEYSVGSGRGAARRLAGGVEDAGGAEPVATGDEVEVDGAGAAVQGPEPEVASRPVGRRLDVDRDHPAAEHLERGVPPHRARQDDRHVTRLEGAQERRRLPRGLAVEKGLRVDEVHDRPVQAGVPGERRAGRARIAVVAEHARRVDPDQRAAEPGRDGLRQRFLPGAVHPDEEERQTGFDQRVGGPEVVRKPVGDHQLVERQRRREQPAAGGDVGVLLGKQEVGDVLVEGEEPSEARALGLLPVGEQPDGAAPDERRVGGEDAPARELFLRRRAEELQCQLDRRTPLRDVVLDVGVEGLPAEIDLRREGEQDDVALECVEAEGAAEPRQG